MSELTPCNFCSLNRYRRQAAQEGKKIIVLPGETKDFLPSGFDVYMIPKGVKLEKETRKQYRISWMWEIPDRCCC